MKQKYPSKNLGNKQMENLIIWIALVKRNTKISLQQFLPLTEAKIQLKPILDIFLRGSSVYSYPQHSLKVLLLLNPTSLKVRTQL
jgi:hypothetical protein